MKKMQKNINKIKKSGFQALGLGLALVLAEPALNAGQSASEFNAPGLDLSTAYAFPVPFKPGQGGNINFINLSTEATIQIFSLNGELVKTLHEDNSDGILSWDVTDEDGKPLGSDTFFYIIENQEQKKVGKILVVR